LRSSLDMVVDEANLTEATRSGALKTTDGWLVLTRSGEGVQASEKEMCGMCGQLRGSRD